MNAELNRLDRLRGRARLARARSRQARVAEAERLVPVAGAPCCDRCAAASSYDHYFAALTTGIPFEAKVAHIGKETADGRLLLGLTWGDQAPLPTRLRWQRMSSDGHNEAELVGQVDNYEINAAGEVIATGLISDISDLIVWELRHGLPWGVSVGLGYIVTDPEYDPASDTGPAPIRAEIVEVTITSDPAEPDTWIRLVEPPPVPDTSAVADAIDTIAKALGVTATQSANSTATTLGVTASVASAATGADPLVRPPAEWFQPFETTDAFVVIPDGPERGRAYGVVASSACHLGLLDGGRCVTPTSDGLPLLIHRPGRFTTSGRLNTAPIFGGIGHLYASAAETLAHYSDRDDQVGVDVVYHWQPDGSLAAFGAARPGVSDAQIARWNASRTSYHRTRCYRGQELAPGVVMPNDGWIVAGVAFVGEGGQAPAGSQIAASVQHDRGSIIESPNHFVQISPPPHGPLHSRNP